MVCSVKDLEQDKLNLTEKHAVDTIYQPNWSKPLHRCSSTNNSTKEPVKELSYTLDKKQSTTEQLSNEELIGGAKLEEKLCSSEKALLNHLVDVAPVSQCFYSQHGPEGWSHLQALMQHKKLLLTANEYLR